MKRYSDNTVWLITIIFSWQNVFDQIFGEAMLALKSIKEFGKGVYRLTKIGDYHASTNSVILWRFICRINRNTQRSQKRPATSNRQILSQNLIEYILSGEYNGN
jgi:hypothetical protein